MDVRAHQTPGRPAWGSSPHALLRELTAEAERVLRGIEAGSEAGVWVPAADIHHQNGQWRLVAELPGLRRDQIQVEVRDEALILHGVRRREQPEDPDGEVRWERHYGPFYRSIPLPEGAKIDQVKAELRDGLLEVTIPVAEVQKRARQVPVFG